MINSRVFFFADYQGSRQNAPAPVLASVAPEAWRRGDLSSVTATITDPLTGLAFPGNQIPVERISAPARGLVNDVANYPLPNRTVPGGVLNNFVGDTLLAIRAHQGDVRLDWSQSTNNKFFGRYSFARYEDRRDEQPFPLFLTARNDQPFDNVGFNWNRVFGSSIINEFLVGYSRTTVITETLDWAGVGDANALYGIAGGQPIAGLSQIQWGSSLTLPGAIATDSETLAKTYQLNEKLTWIRGRHGVKLGGQFLRYNQRRFYAGNNGRLGFLTHTGAFTGFAFSDFLLDQVAGKGRGGGDPDDPWTHLQNRISLFAQDDFKVRQNLTLNLGLRWAFTSPLVEKNNRQSNFDLTSGQQIFAEDGGLEDRALYRRTTTAGSHASGSLGAPATASSSAAAMASPSLWRAPARTSACR
ncbi:MAG: TonB-dependent receptor [Acidobacteria bacterium]|nr:TonB-dependent receptor [Acidobacteriota bacterium]